MPAPFDPICLFEVLAAHDVDFVVIGGMAAVLKGQVDLIYLCFPNNPTGKAMPADDIARIAEATDGFVVYFNQVIKPWPVFNDTAGVFPD